MNTDLEQSLQKLKDLGFDNDRLTQLLDLATEEALEIALNEMLEKLSDQELEEISKELEAPINNKEDAKEKTDLIFKKVYKDQAENKKIEFINEYLKETIQITENSKDLLDRYQQGDPRAVATIQSQMNDPDVQAIQNAK